MVKGPEQILFQRRHKNGQQVHEKMLVITHPQGNEIKTTMRYHLTPARMVILKETTDNKCWRGCVKKRTLCTDGMNVNCYSHYGKNMEFSQKNKNRNIYK